MLDFIVILMLVAVLYKNSDSRFLEALLLFIVLLLLFSISSWLMMVAMLAMILAAMFE